MFVFGEGRAVFPCEEGVDADGTAGMVGEVDDAAFVGSCRPGFFVHGDAVP